MGLSNPVGHFLAQWFIQRDRPVHMEIRKVIHGYFTPGRLPKKLLRIGRREMDRHLGAALNRLAGREAFKALAVAWNGASVR